jgi:hypothetical protein
LSASRLVLWFSARARPWLWWDFCSRCSHDHSSDSSRCCFYPTVVHLSAWCQNAFLNASCMRSTWSHLQDTLLRRLRRSLYSLKQAPKCMCLKV